MQNYLPLILSITLTLLGCSTSSKETFINSKGNLQFRLVASKKNAVNKSTVLKSNTAYEETLYLTPQTVLDSSSVELADTEIDPASGMIFIGVKLRPGAHEYFRNFTQKHIGERIAFIVDGKVIAAPVISEAIPNGLISIYGNFTLFEAKELTEKINATSSK